MIQSIELTYYKWNVITGVMTRYFEYPDDVVPNFDLNIMENGIENISQFNQLIEGLGDRIEFSDVGFDISDVQLRNAPFFDAALNTIGNIQDSLWGIIKPLTESSGEYKVFAQVVIYGLHEPFPDAEFEGGNLRKGCISAYPEYIETKDIDGVDTEVVDCFLGYIELDRYSHKIYEFIIQVDALALDKLVGCISASVLKIKKLASLDTIQSRIRYYCPFITAHSITETGLGIIPFLVNKFSQEDDNLDAWDLTSHLIIPSAPNDFGDLQNSFFPILTERYGNGIDKQEEHWVQLGQREGDYKLIKIELDPEDNSITISEPTNNLPTEFEHTEGIYYPFVVPSPSKASRFQHISSNTLTNQTAMDIDGRNRNYYRLFPLAKNSGENIRGAQVCTNPDILKNFPDGYKAILFLISLYGDICHHKILQWKLGTEDNWDMGTTLAFSGYLDDGKYDFTEFCQVIWREGFQRIFVITDNKDRLYCTPCPEYNEEHSNWLNTLKLIDNSLSCKVFTVAAHLGAGDKPDAPTRFFDEADETFYTQYPIYYKNSAGKSFVRLGGKSSMAAPLGFNIDGEYHTGGAIYNSSFDERWLYWYDLALKEDIPDDLPVEPIFTYDGRNRLEIWFYSESKKALLCFNWKMELVYAYTLGVDANRVALGRTRAGRLMVVVSLEDQFLVAIHEASSELFLPSAADGATAETLLTDICRYGFQSWWVERIVNSTELGSENTLVIRPRYRGNDRGAITILTHSQLSEINNNDEDNPPNRDFERTVWEKYADRIVIKSEFGEVAVGLPNSIYTFNYDIGKGVHNRDLMERIGYILLSIMSKRREYLKVPTLAMKFRHYDIVKLFGRDYTIINGRSDYEKALITDLECVQLGNIYNDMSLLECVLRGLSYVYQLGSAGFWYYDHKGYGLTCYCNACQVKFENLMNGIIALFQDYGSPEISFDFNLDDLERESYVNLITTNFDYETTGGKTLLTLLIEYKECLKNSCSIDYYGIDAL